MMRISYSLLALPILITIISSLILTDVNAMTVKHGDISGMIRNGTYQGNLTYYGDTGEKNSTKPVTIKILDKNGITVQSYIVSISTLDRNNGTFTYNTHISGSYPSDNYTLEFSYGKQTIKDSWHPPHIESASPTLTLSGNQAVINTALAIPELQNWSHNWQYVHTAFLGNNKAGTTDFKWQYAMVYLKTPPNSGLIPCDIGWEAEVTVDTTTMKVVSADYPTMNSQCHGVGITGGGPGIPSDITTTVSPLQQFKLGINEKDITCKQGLQLIIKAEDGSPACVKPNAANILIERGWAKILQ